LKTQLLSSRLVRNSVLLVVLAVFGLALLWTYMLGDSGEPPYTYSQLLTDAGAGKIQAITMDGDRLAVTPPVVTRVGRGSLETLGL